MCVCVCTYACVTCAPVCVQAKVSILVFSLLRVCMSEIKFVWEIGKEELRDERVKEAKDGQI